MCYYGRRFHDKFGVLRIYGRQKRHLQMTSAKFSGFLVTVTLTQPISTFVTFGPPISVDVISEHRVEVSLAGWLCLVPRVPHFFRRCFMSSCHFGRREEGRTKKEVAFLFLHRTSAKPQVSSVTKMGPIQKQSSISRPTGISSHLGTKLRDWANRQAGAGCYS